jgi:hypothetical protein
MSNVAKLTDAVLACPPNLDCYQHGAAVYYSIPYADVTPQQRDAVKSLTSLARYAEGHRFDPLAAARVHDEIVISVDPAHRERVVSSASLIDEIMNQTPRKALLDLDALTRLVPDDLLEHATNQTTFPRPNRFRWDAEHMNEPASSSDMADAFAFSTSPTGRRQPEYTPPLHELPTGPLHVSSELDTRIGELFQRVADAMNVPVRFVDPQRGLSSVGETERETWARLVREQSEARGYRGPTDVSLDRNIPRTHVDWLDPPKPKVWPRDYPEDVVRDVLDFVARGEFTRNNFIGFLLDIDVESTAPGYTPRAPIADACIRRAKLERRIRWCPYSQLYVARPAWQHRPKHDRRGWSWPLPAHLGQRT